MLHARKIQSLSLWRLFLWLLTSKLLTKRTRLEDINGNKNQYNAYTKSWIVYCRIAISLIYNLFSKTY